MSRAADGAAVRIGLDRLAADGCAALAGLRVGLLCHAASVASDLRHPHGFFGTPRSRSCMAGPEHGIWADART
ncbi:MAG: hypothetical protein R3F60_31745 [bacterium]